jgi:hypothetical protein
MKVFLSWSGDKSRALAEIFSRWLPGILQAVQPFLSPDEVAKGVRWADEAGCELEGSAVGLLFLTPDNLQAPWVMFEAGAMSRDLEACRIFPLLFEVQDADIRGPLTQFRGRRFNKTEIWKLLVQLNGALESGQLDVTVLETAFELWWPQLDRQVAYALSVPAVGSVGELRSDREILEELLEIARSKTGRAVSAPTNRTAIRDVVVQFTALVNALDHDGILEVYGSRLSGLHRALEVLARSHLEGTPMGTLAETQLRNVQAALAFSNALEPAEPFVRP